VLLHAFAGRGKTSTAAEFARWYALTGGVEGPVLFSSFERYLPLARVLDKIGEVFGQALEASGIHWNAITDLAQRRSIALQVLQQVPVLWIWDNVEPVAGFPAGTASEWSAAEEQELRAFVSAARETKAKFLMTSRRDEAAWLGELPRRVQVPAMPMQERLQLARAIVERRSKRLADLPELTPLLRFTRGNPLTILVTLGEALRAGIDTPARLDAFVADLHRGEVAFEDEASEGRTKSLGASLSYGFDTAFTDDERKRLQQVRVDWNRQRAQPALTVPPDPRDATQRNTIRTLAASLQGLAHMQRMQGSPTCAATYREALDFANAIRDTAVQATCAFNLGHAYKDIAALRNLNEAERWYRKSLDLTPDDRLARGLRVGQLGLVAFERFLEAQTAKRPVEELVRHLAEAARLYGQALDMMPATAVTERGIIHNQLGNIYVNTGDINRALHHYQQDIRYCEQTGDIFGASEARRNVAIALRAAGRPSDARAYAEAALANFRTFGDRAADRIQHCESLIAAIDQAIAKKAGGA
jgi:hypothetical protein